MVSARRWVLQFSIRIQQSPPFGHQPRRPCDHQPSLPCGHPSPQSPSRAIATGAHWARQPLPRAAAQSKVDGGATAAATIANCAEENGAPPSQCPKLDIATGVRSARARRPRAMDNDKAEIGAMAAATIATCVADVGAPRLICAFLIGSLFLQFFRPNSWFSKLTDASALT
jgi:hypothetical protein